MVSGSRVSLDLSTGAVFSSDFGDFGDLGWSWVVLGDLGWSWGAVFSDLSTGAMFSKGPLSGSDGKRLSH